MAKKLAPQTAGSSPPSNLQSVPLKHEDVRMLTEDEVEDACADAYSDGKMDGYSRGLTAAIQVIADAMAADNFTDARATAQLQSLLMSVTRKYQEDIL